MPKIPNKFSDLLDFFGAEEINSAYFNSRDISKFTNIPRRFRKRKEWEFTVTFRSAFSFNWR